MRINTFLTLVFSVSVFSLNAQAHDGPHEKETDMKHSCMNHDKKDSKGSEMSHEKCEHMDHSKMKDSSDKATSEDPAKEHSHDGQEQKPKEEDKHDHNAH